MAKKKETQGNQEFLETLNKSEAFVHKYKKHIYAALIALVVIIGGLIFWNNYSKSRNEKASTALAKGQEWFMNQDFEKALNGDSLGTPGFKKIINDYSGTKAANLANLYAGLCLAKQNKWEEAVKYLESYKPADDLEVSPAAVMALGDCYANLKQYDKAVESFKEAAKIADKASKDGINNSIAPVALKKAAIILSEQLKKKDEALEIFKTIKEKYLSSAVYQEADKYIEYLENK
jgi:tetratricopeptide (TPR) repeat protein